MTDKERKMRVITLRIPPDLYDRLSELAEQERRSLNAEAIVLLESALKDRDKDEASRG